MCPCPGRLRTRTSSGNGGGDKTGNDGFYEAFVPLAELRKEGLIE